MNAGDTWRNLENDSDKAIMQAYIDNVVKTSNGYIGWNRTVTDNQSRQYYEFDTDENALIFMSNYMDRTNPYYTSMIEMLVSRRSDDTIPPVAIRNQLEYANGYTVNVTYNSNNTFDTSDI